MFKFGARSEDNLIDVHPDLVRVCRRALELSHYDFMILDGLRTMKEQEINLANGASQTKNSLHLRQPSGYSHAIDFGAWVEGVYVNGDTPDEYRFYEKIADAFKVAALECRVPIVWGGDWKKFKDAGHIELDRRKYS